MQMRKPMLNAVQKVKIAMAKKKPKLSMRKPKLNPGFDALPSSVQKKMMKGKKPKMMGMKKVKLMGPGLGQKKGKRKNPKMAMRNKK